MRSCRISRPRPQRRSRACRANAGSLGPLRRGERPPAASSRPTATPKPGRRRCRRCGRNGEELSKLRRAESSGPGHDLEAKCVGSDGDGLDEAVVADAVGKFGQFGFIEGPAGVGGGFVDGVDGKELELAAVLHEFCLRFESSWQWLFSQTRLGPGPRQRGRQGQWCEKVALQGPAGGHRKRIPGAARRFFHRLARARSRAPQQAWYAHSFDPRRRRKRKPL